MNSTEKLLEDSINKKMLKSVIIDGKLQDVTWALGFTETCLFWDMLNGDVPDIVLIPRKVAFKCALYEYEQYTANGMNHEDLENVLIHLRAYWRHKL